MVKETHRNKQNDEDDILHMYSVRTSWRYSLSSSSVVDHDSVGHIVSASVTFPPQKLFHQADESREGKYIQRL